MCHHTEIKDCSNFWSIKTEIIDLIYWGSHFFASYVKLRGMFVAHLVTFFHKPLFIFNHNGHTLTNANVEELHAYLQNKLFPLQGHF